MIVLSSNSIDELNLIYKKVKKDFQAVEGIKLNSATCEYELKLERPQLSKALIAIADKIIEIDEMLEEKPSVFDDFSWMKMKNEVEKGKLKYMSLQPLKTVWGQLKPEIKKAFFDYLCVQKEIEPKLGQNSNKLVA